MCGILLRIMPGLTHILVPQALALLVRGQEEELLLEEGQLTAQLQHYLPNHWFKVGAPHSEVNVFYVIRH